ncbi:MAG TPA: fatty acid desaturase [Burkholderiaceae bacterium]|nr:fatty acid desaturase [Burkholderiaceae bacterium]
MSSARFRLNADELRELSARRDGPGLRRAAAHLGAVVLGMAAIAQAGFTWWVVPLILLTGWPMAFLFNAMHECAHQTAFRTRGFNLALGHAAGLFIMLPYEYYRHFHWDHHRHTQQPGLDPEMGLNLPHTRGGLLWLMLGFPVWFKRNVPTLLRHAAGRVQAPWVPEDKRPLIVREARAYLAVYALIAAGALAAGPGALLVWLAPLAAGQMLLRPYLLAEHTGCGQSRDMFENSRSIDTHALVRFFAWNMPYHAEHHAYPAVPFHALPRLRERAAPYVRRRTPGYLAAVRQVFAFLVRGQEPPHTGEVTAAAPTRPAP